GVAHRALQLARDDLHRARGYRLLDLLVDPQHLLTARHDARLGGGGPRRRDGQVAVREARLGQLGTHRVTARVVADDGDQPAFRPDRRDVGGHVRGAPQRVTAAVHGDDGDGGFRRDAVHFAGEIDVEHRVAQHDDADARHFAEQLLDVLAGQGSKLSFRNRYVSAIVPTQRVLFAPVT